MSISLDFVDVLDFLHALEIRNISESAGEANFSCPGPQHTRGDTRPSARMNLKTALWVCHGCGERGNAITFLAWHRGLSETVAKRLLEERYGGSLTAPIDDLASDVRKIMRPLALVENREIPDESWIEAFALDWHKPPVDPIFAGPMSYMLTERGFTPEALERWQIGYDPHSDRITIPVRDERGRLVGFKGRGWRAEQQPKYLILGDGPRREPYYGFDTYRKSEYVFGLDHAIQRNPNPSRELVVVEGELNVVAMDQHGFTNAVGIAGSEFSGTQASLVVQHASSAVVWLDDDPAGRGDPTKVERERAEHEGRSTQRLHGTKKVTEALSLYMAVRLVLGAPGDANELDRDAIDVLLRGAQSSIVVKAREMLWPRTAQAL